MADMERIAARLRAAIAKLQAREDSLTRLEHLKLASLSRNLKRVLAAMSSPEKCSKTGGGKTAECTCAECELPSTRS